MIAGSYRRWATRALLLASLAGIALATHAPNHLLSVVGRLGGQPELIDALHWTLPPALRGAFWLPWTGFAVALLLASRPTAEALAPRGERRDLLWSALVVVAAFAIRAGPLLWEPWIKPDPDEGVYLGGAWLLRDGVLPYRDYVFAHPPGSLLLLQPAAALIRLWQDNSPALRAARATAAFSDAMAAGLVYLAARQLVGRPGALLAALVYVADTLAIEFSRGVRLEPLQAPWLVLGGALVLAAINGRRTGFAAGLCLAVGVGTKLTGIVVPLGALAALAWFRRWQAVGGLISGLIAGGVALGGWFLLTAGDEPLRQAVLLQLQRPPEPYRERWEFLLGDRWTGFTAIAALLGAGALGWRAWRRSVSPGWVFVGLWLALTYLLLAAAGSFYDHYYTALVAPLALLAAALPNMLRNVRPWLMPLSAIVLLPLGWGQVQLWRAVDRAPAQRMEVDALLPLQPGEPVFSFNPISSILAGRPIIAAPGGPALLDLFLGPPYLDSPLNTRWPDSDTVRAQAGAAATFILGTRFSTTPIPDLKGSFIWREVTPSGEPVLFERVDQPDEVVRVGEELELLRRSLARIETVDDTRILVQTLHWRAAATPPPDLALGLYLADTANRRVAQLDVPVNGNVAWESGAVTTLQYRMPLPAGLAPGSYRLSATVYSWADGSVLPLATAAGTVNELPLPPVTFAAE